MSYTNQRYMSSCLDVLNHEILNYTEATGGLDMNLKYRANDERVRTRSERGWITI